MGNATAEQEVLVYLVKRAPVSLILEFADLLEKYQVGFDYRTQQAFMDEKLLRL